MEKVVERFLRYVKYDTRSEEDVEAFPSTQNQLVLLKAISEELQNIGLKDVSMDEHGYVIATLPGNLDKKTPVVGFISHVDTNPEMPGDNIKPLIIENYNGEDIVLNKELGVILSPKEFKDLKKYVGDTIIATDGTTLLGADDKSGVSEIITAVEYLINHPEIKHGEVRVGFTPDEEVGRGVDFFDVKKFNADFAYTVDGGSLGELEYENFNAARANIVVNGKNAHPGAAKDIMVNSILIAMELNSMLPKDETPSNTEGYEGFYHILDFTGTVEITKLKYIIRDFDLDKLNKRKEKISEIVDKLNKKYGEGTIILDLKNQYYNMLEKIKENMYVVDIAKKAMKELGIKPIISPIRGGTDGARLCFMGLPTPNLFTGGHNFHGKYEYAVVSSMKKSVDVILKIIELVSKR